MTEKVQIHQQIFSRSSNCASDGLHDELKTERRIFLSLINGSMVAHYWLTWRHSLRRWRSCWRCLRIHQSFAVSPSQIITKDLIHKIWIFIKTSVRLSAFQEKKQFSLNWPLAHFQDVCLKLNLINKTSQEVIKMKTLNFHCNFSSWHQL